MFAWLYLSMEEVIMKKATISLSLLLVICLLCLTVFSGCEIFITNDRSDVMLMAVDEREDGLCFYLGNNYFYGRAQTLFYDYANGAFSKGEVERDHDFLEAVLYGKNIAHDRLRAIEGYESLLEQVLAFTVEDVEYPIHHALAYKQGDVIYGFCNIYSTSGLFTDGLDCKGIGRSILFTYDEVTDELTVVEELGARNVLAFDGTGVIWFEDKAYYGKELGGEPIKICDDIAYGSDYAYTDFYFGDGYCLLYLHKEKTYLFNSAKNERYDTYILVTTCGEKIAEYTQSNA